jgi:23S rRNA (adenine2503-C2)-methyltransferase
MSITTKRFDSSEGNVWKYVFDFGNAISEAVLYQYQSFYDRTVLCISVQSGCPVGCKFCGTGNKFIRNLSSEEIIHQVKHCLSDMKISDVDTKGKRFQIMFMSMGEPLLNFKNVEEAIIQLNIIYPNAELLISTVAPTTFPIAYYKLYELSRKINKIGLQFSIHEAFDNKRDILIPYENKLNLSEIRDVGINWNKITGRPVYLNYCVHENNHSEIELQKLKDLFSPVCFNFTFSVICSPDENMKNAGFKNLDLINKISDSFLKSGYNVRVFDPAGQDDIGGGCGQLWYVQNWLKNYNK